MRFMAAAARAAARRRLLVSFHGVTVPRGLERTWPNVLTYEGVLGAEHAKPGTPIDPAHDVDLVFTRNAIGPMDYTPAALSARGQRSTMAHRLAQAIAFQSGLQSYADTPASYAAHPAALALLGRGARRVGRHAAARRASPAATPPWRGAPAAPGSSAACPRPRRARRPSACASWAPARTLRPSSPTTAPAGLATSTRAVTAADALRVPLAADGGFTVQLAPR